MRKLLDAWSPPDGAGMPLGCLATTFTFEPAFFEEECLSRFLDLESDAHEGGAAYLIEREEKLAQAYAAVLVDRRHVNSQRSLRWDILPVRVQGAVQHAKVSILAWERVVRVIVASANLTEPAYRRNLEVFGCLDFGQGSDVSPEILLETVSFLKGIVGRVPGDPEQPGPRRRVLDLLEQIRQRTDQLPSGRAPKRDEVRVVLVFGGDLNGRRLSVLGQLKDQVWPAGGPPRDGRVLSPFFDKDGGRVDAATEAFLEVLARRGDCRLVLVARGSRNEDGSVRLHAPEAVRRTVPKRVKLECYRYQAEQNGEVRPLHAKSIWLKNAAWCVYMVGSSNFTRAGLGVGTGPINIEANLAYLVRTNASAVRQLDQIYPPCEKVPDPDRIVWEPAEDPDGQARESDLLPSGFVEALFEPRESGGTLLLHFGENLPTQWAVFRTGDPGAILYDRAVWLSEALPASRSLEWTEVLPPTSVTVQWTGQDGQMRSAEWPVNVTDPASLSPPAELRDLPLEVLVEILTSARSLHEVVLSAREREERRKTRKHQDETDPHKKVRTETFLLQRTRRLAYALEQLRIRLNRPALHREALAWRLHGPVGPLAMARALAREARSDEEARFLLAEVALTLARVDRERIARFLSREEVDAAFRDVMGEIKALAVERGGQEGSALDRYVQAAFVEVVT